MQKKKTMAIIGDSLSLPRDDIPFEKTYAALLENDYDIVMDSVYGNTTRDACNGSLFSVLLSDYVIVHLGIVDCFPRLLDARTRKILSIFPAQVRKIALYPITKYRYEFTKTFPKVLVSKDEFYWNMVKLLSKIRSSNAIPIIIDISDVSNSIACRNYGVRNNIFSYNDVLRKLIYQYDCVHVNLNYMTRHYSEMIHKDGQHLSETGHAILYGMIKDEIRQLGGIKK
ncbi:MAG: hypothetical protein EHM34_00165 [Nitrosopumilales archaeon]|nr:MAG: hypothetical protein EHM34_00165 [Nitrosopumilales archaeon]